LKEAEMLSPPWIALNRGAIVEPLFGHQNPHPSRAAGSFFDPFVAWLGSQSFEIAEIKGLCLPWFAIKSPESR
jgi:hypothetical protein